MAGILRAGEPEALTRAAEVIERGGLVIVPTETFYGIAVDAFNPDAVARIFEIKGRPASMQLPLVAAGLEQIERQFGALDAATARAARAFWPGPLSLLISVTGRSQDSVTARSTANRQPITASQSVAVRVPSHDFVRQLCERTGTLLTATSANRTGEAPARTAQDAHAALGDAVDLIVDGGTAPGGQPSTIADLRAPEPRLIRDGAIGWDAVLEAFRED